MKALAKILAIVGLVFACASCETNLDIHQLGDPSTFVAPALNGPGSINISASDVALDNPVTFSWSAGDFGQPTEIVYTITASYNGNNATLFTNITGLSYDAKSSELASKLTTLGVANGKSASVTFNVTCTIGSNFTVLTSADKSISVFVE